MADGTAVGAVRIALDADGQFTFEAKPAADRRDAVAAE
jgi:hypothetical protein